MADDRNRTGPHDDRGYFERAADGVRAYFGDENAERRNDIHGRGGPMDERTRDDMHRARNSPIGEPGHARGGSFDEDKGFFGSGYGAGGDRWARGPKIESRGGGDHQHPPHHEPEYRAWREEQARQLDREYEEFRRHRQGRFHEEFEDWRTNRHTMAGAELTGEKWRTKIREHQEVLGSDGEHVGTVDVVEGDFVKLTREDVGAGGEHHFVPLSDIISVDIAVRLKGTAEEVRRSWRGESRGTMSY